MTTINSIANLLVTECGLSEVEAFEMAEHEFNGCPTYAEFILIDAEEDRRRAEWEREMEEERREWLALNKFYNEHIAGKTYDEVNADDWQYYSDWYKDVNGIRPRWIMQSLYEDKMRAERDAERDMLEDEGWIMLTDRDGWYTYERQLTPSRMTIWRWDNCGDTFEWQLKEILKKCELVGGDI